MFLVIYVGILMFILGACLGGIGGYVIARRIYQVDTYEWFKAGMDAEHEYYRARFGGETNPDRPF